MSDRFEQLQAVVFDWAGTMVDHGSRAPAIVFQEIFRQRGIPISVDQAREPMGMAKRDHITAIAAMPEVGKAWQEKYGALCSDSDIDAMYADFLPLQKKTLGEHCALIPGVAQVAAECRRRGLKLGSSTGYTRELMEVVTAATRPQGYEPDCVLCAEDALQGRPAPFLLYEAALRLQAYPLWRFVKVDDTPVGIQAGQNAGCWTIGITRTGNGVGLSLEELAALPADQVEALCERAGRRLTAAGADYLLESVADILPILDEIESRLASGQRPPCGN